MKKNYITRNISETFTTTFDHQFNTIEEHNLRTFEIFWEVLDFFSHPATLILLIF